MLSICPKCSTEFDNYSKFGDKKFCSRKCSNSRGPRTEEFKQIIREKAIGRKQSIESIQKSIESKGQVYKYLLPNTNCIICNVDTGSKTRKTCSDICYKLNCKLNSQRNPNCGGQKHTHRSKITNINGEQFVAESSFEVIVADSLNENNVLWVRPQPVWYIDANNKTRRYYPDFYLSEYDVYLDPKNDHLIKTDIDKIIRSANQNKIKIIILGEKYLPYSMYKNMVAPAGTAPTHPTCKEGVLLLN